MFIIGAVRYLQWERDAISAWNVYLKDNKQMMVNMYKNSHRKFIFFCGKIKFLAKKGQNLKFFISFWKFIFKTTFLPRKTSRLRLFMLFRTPRGHKKILYGGFGQKVEICFLHGVVWLYPKSDTLHPQIYLK